MNIIGDVGGQFVALQKLISLMPDDDLIFVGDLVDRGPRSKDVVQFVIDHGRSIMGTHENLLVDFVFKQGRYSNGEWLKYGGRKTLSSYGIYKIRDIEPSETEVFQRHCEWMRSLPSYFKTPELLVTHAPLSAIFANVADADLNSLVHNCEEPIRRDYFQVFGHLGKFRQFGEYAMCVDDSHNGNLIGLNFPSLKLYQVKI